MRKFTPTGPWGGPLLHVYVLPGAAVREAIAAYQAQVVDPSESGVVWQPPEWAHVTVQRLDVAPDALPDGALDRLRARLADMPADIGGYPLRMGPPMVGTNSVEGWLTPSNDFKPLVDHVRTAVIIEGLVPWLPEARVNRPHLAMGYGTGPGDSGELQQRLKGARVDLAPLPLSTLHLVSARYTSSGWFEWDSIAKMPVPEPPAPDPWTGRQPRPDRDPSQIEATARGIAADHSTNRPLW